MRSDLLLKGAALLEKDAANPKGVKFDLQDWAVGKYDEDNGGHAPVSLDCGTHACAVGLFILSGEFVLDGLLPHDEDAGSLAPRYIDPRDDDIRTAGWGAVQTLFDITSEEAHFLFDGGAYTVSKGAEAELLVAQRIREFVANN